MNNKYVFYILLAIVSFTLGSVFNPNVQDMAKHAMFKLFDNENNYFQTKPVVSEPSVVAAAPGTGTNNTIADIAEAVSPAVVSINVIAKNNMTLPPEFDDPFFKKFYNIPKEQKGSGSGFIFDKKGYILTNAHVVKNATDIQVVLGNSKTYVGKVIGVDEKLDMAVVKINADNLPVVSLGDSDKARAGEWVVAIGNPLGRFSHTVTVGIISAKDRDNLDLDIETSLIQTDAAINPGNSGGPLLNMQGQVIGMNTAIIQGAEGIGFAIPINSLKQNIIDIMKDGKIKKKWKPMLGVYLSDVTNDMAQFLGLPKATGALIQNVVPGSLAHRNGLKAGDVIWLFKGKAINNSKELQDAVKSVQEGEKVEVKIWRNGEIKKFDITFED